MIRPYCSRLVVVMLIGSVAMTVPGMPAMGQETPIISPAAGSDETAPSGVDEGGTIIGEEPTGDMEALSLPEPESSPSRSSAWSPPLPAPDDYDWIRLTSGEWLKGDIRFLRDEQLEFDSDELDELTFDWEDVAELRSPRWHTYVFEDRTVVYGTALIRDGRIVISSAGEEQEFLRVRLMSIVPGGKRRRDYWSGKGSVGLAFRRGNTMQTDLTYQGFVRRQDALTRARFDYDGGIGEQDGKLNNNNHRGNLKLDIFLGPRFYVTPLVVEAFHDQFTNIDLRLKPGIGTGYTIIKKSKIECDIELTGGFQYIRYISVEAGEDIEEGSGVITPRIRLETEITKWVDFDALYSITVAVTNLEDITQHAELILSLELTKRIDLDLAWIWDRIEEPVPNEDGTLPEKDDIRLTVGLGLDF